MSKKVVIVGAGPGGLASAMLLAHAGLDVTVLEKEHYVGGRTSTVHSGGFRRFMEENRDKLKRFAPILERPFYGISDLFKRDILEAMPLLRPWRSLHSEVGRQYPSLMPSQSEPDNACWRRDVLSRCFE